MSLDTRSFQSLVAVDADFKPSVQLPFDFEDATSNERLVRSFIPTSQTITILTEIAASLDPNSTERARALVGTFGTGKSDLLLMIGNYFGRQVDDPLMAPFYERLRNIDPARAGIIRNRREPLPHFLVVLLQADAVSSFPGFALYGLQHALEQVGLAHLMHKTRYSAAHEQVETWRKEGHARYADFCKTLEDYEKMDVSGLLAALNGAQSDDALRVFQRTFKAVTGFDFHVYGYSQPHEAYAEVAQALVATGKHSGIVLVCDEFTAFFERLQGAIDQQLREFEAETKAIENLAERSSSAVRGQIHFIIATLESFASAAGTIGSRTVAQATERSGGRFKQHSLLVEGSEELIRGTIKRLPNAATTVLLPNAQRDDLLEIANDIGKLQFQTQWRNREWVRDVIVEGAFPLHPISTYALPLINQKVAQSQRTMFLFLKDEKGLRGFIQRETLHSAYPGWHRLLTPDLLFDYFRESITTKRSDIHETFEQSEQQIRTATVDTSLATRILKIIALCETVGSDLVMRPTRLFLRRALNLPPAAEVDLDAALHLLEQADAIDSPSDVGSDVGVYRLPMHGRVSVKSLERRITNRAQNLSATDVAKLQAQHPPDDIVAADYNRKRGSHRKLSAYYVGVQHLRSRERLKSDLEQAANRDGLLWYVVTANDAERAEAQSLARELTQQHPRLVVAVPIAPSHVLGALRDYQALEGVRNDPELDQNSKPYLSDKGRVGSEYKSRLDHELKQLADSKQWEWFAGGRGQAGLMSATVAGLASQVMDKVFPDTPTTNLAMHFKAGDVSATTIKAIEQIIKNDIKLDKAAKSPTDSILRTGATSLGLLQQGQLLGSFETFSLIDPKSSASLASGKIWRRINDHLAASKAWASLVKELRQPPYGLYDSILVLFLAAFVARNADAVAIHLANGAARALDVDPQLLKKMLDRPQEYSIRFQPLSEYERRWLRGMVERGLRQADFSPPPGTTLRSAVASRVKTWINRQQIPLFALNLSEAQWTEILPDSDPAAINAAHLLLQRQTNESDVASVLLADLPPCLGAPEQHIDWDQTTVDALLVRWMSVCDILVRLPIALKERVALRAATLFGAETVEPDRRWDMIHRWRIYRNAVNQERLQGFARELFRLTNLVSGSIEQTLFDEFARRVVTVGVEYQRWQDVDKLEKVFAELTKARDEINRAWELVASSDMLWREGLVQRLSGRAVSGVSAEQAAAELAAWNAGIVWPACVSSLGAHDLQAVYPNVGSDVYHDLVHVLERHSYDKPRWLADLAEGLPKAFGIQGWTRAEVNAALKRIETVLPLAAGLDANLRRYCFQRVVRRFAASIDAPAAIPADEVLAQWRKRFAIPEPNDLSSEAKGLLFHINAGVSDVETLLLTTLPRSIVAVGRPVHQWDRFNLLETYIEALRTVIVEIANYEPVSREVYDWFVGSLCALRRAASAHVPRERTRLIDLIATEWNVWLRQQRLPLFVSDLCDDDLRESVPDADPQLIPALLQVLHHDPGAAAQTLVSQELPIALGLDSNISVWTKPDVDSALERLANVCRFVEAIPSRLQERLLTEIGQIFHADTPLPTSADVLAHMRDWRAAYVMLPSDRFSANARLLYDTLGSAEDDADSLLLQRLPLRIAEVCAGYGHWSRWSMRAGYLNALQAAAGEISERAKVGAGSESADSFWHEFRERLRALSDDEQRWVIKAFSDEFQQ